MPCKHTPSAGGRLALSPARRLIIGVLALITTAAVTAAVTVAVEMGVCLSAGGDVAFCAGATSEPTSPTSGPVG